MKTFEPAYMARARGQVLYRYRPGQTFDHKQFIARVTGFANDDGFLGPKVDEAQVVQEAMRLVQRWRSAGANAQGTANGSDRAPEFPPEEPLASTQYEIIIPGKVFYRVWPRTVRCSNPHCGRIWDAPEPTIGTLWPPSCPSCRCADGNHQLQYLFVHECGEAAPLVPPARCRQNHTTFRLDTRAARFLDFRWECLTCSYTEQVRFFCGNPGCSWTNKQMALQVHTASSAFVGHGFSIVNVLVERHAELRKKKEFAVAALGRWLGECTNAELEQVLGGQASPDVPKEVQDSIAAMEKAGLVEQARALRAKFFPIDFEQLRRRVGSRLGFDPLDDQGRGLQLASNLDAYERVLHLPRLTLDDIKQYASPQRLGTYENYAPVLVRSGFDPTAAALVKEFPVVYVAFGYSRAGFEPRETDLVPYKGRGGKGQAVKTLLYANPVNTEALVFALDRTRVARWLVANRAAAAEELNEPGGVVRWFASRMADYDGRLPPPWSPEPAASTDPSYGPQLLFRLLHSVAHQMLRAVAVDSGFSETALSEYLFPYALAFAIHPNAQSEFTIGGLRTVFEQNLDQIVQRAVDNFTCLYDPNCMTATRGVDHGCLQLPETSCQCWNWFLSRWELFGEPSSAPDRIHGYWSIGID